MEAFAWKDRPALIEHLFPSGKISAESYKEQMAGSGKALTCLGSYWKGRKPLILNKACILGCLLPATDDHFKDLEIFEMLMGMDRRSMIQRILGNLSLNCAYDAETIIEKSFREQVEAALRPEEIEEYLFNHIWDSVNDHLGTDAHSFPELIEQMGIARFGHRAKVADVFCGSGQIPFEAARLGCDVYASDLNPIASLLTWGAFNLVGADKEKKERILLEQKRIIGEVQEEIDELMVEFESDFERINHPEEYWRGKSYLYCVETTCPKTGWKVPMLTTCIISKPRSGVKNNVCVYLQPDEENKRYNIKIIDHVKDSELSKYKNGTVQDNSLVHSPDGKEEIRIPIKVIRGDYTSGNETKNKLRQWEKTDFIPREDDIFQERLYCIQWIKKRENTNKMYNYEFREVTKEDLVREQRVIDYLSDHIIEWQEKGYLPSMRIEKGDKTDEPIRTRGWTHWHHLFNPRQLLVAGLIRQRISGNIALGLFQELNHNSRLSVWDPLSNCVQNTFYNQALNTLYCYGCRNSIQSLNLIELSLRNFCINENLDIFSSNHPASELSCENDIYITDPPYGDAVKYEEILEFFIAWLQKNPPKEFAQWTWDSRRPLAIKGEGEEFRQKMIASYTAMRDHMPDNGIQILMFTHKSGSLWADLANIIWASGLRVTAAWCVTTESDSAIRQGANIKSTVILVLRKRLGNDATYRDDLGEEIAEAVEEQVKMLTGLDQQVRQERSEGLYADADLQMAGYAAALKVLTSYSTIDGKDMTFEAKAPKKDEKGFVDELIEFAEMTAVQYLVPNGFKKEDWKNLQPIERFYCKMAELEAKGEKSLDNYQKFAKAFKVKFADQVLSEKSKANSARLKLGLEMKGNLMSGNYEIVNTPLRAILYASYELGNEMDISDVLFHLTENCPEFFARKELVTRLSRYLSDTRKILKASSNFQVDKEASNLSVLSEAIQRM